MCKWLFIVVNSIMVIVNLADSVYFSYTLRRTSWSVFGEFGNETNLGKVAGVELLSHWYLVVLAAALIWGMWKLYVNPALDIRRQNLVRYYILSVLSLAVAGVTAYVADFSIIGITTSRHSPSPTFAGYCCAGERRQDSAQEPAGLVQSLH